MKYTGMAGATVVGTSFIPVPLADAIPLMAIQRQMFSGISKAYGMDSELVLELLSAGALSYVGKTLVTQVITLIPVLGGSLKAVVNVSAAAGVTATVGAAWVVICEKFVDSGADEDEFSDYISKDLLKEAIVYVKDNKDEFGIDEIKDRVVKENENKKIKNNKSGIKQGSNNKKKPSIFGGSKKESNGKKTGIFGSSKKKS